MRELKRALVVGAFVALPGQAQSAAPADSSPPSLASVVDTLRPVIETRPIYRVDGGRSAGDEPRGSRRAHHARVGAVVGAAVGAAAGAVGSTFIGVGCAASSTSCATRAHLDLALLFGTLGAVAGAGSGAIIGALFP